MLKQLQRPPPPTAVEQRSIQLADKLITYTLKRSSRRRSIGLQINDHGLTVSMPLRASEKWLHTVLQEKAGWVVNKLENWQTSKAPVQKWVDGELIMFRGETFTLRTIVGRVKALPQIMSGELLIHVPETGKPLFIKKTILKWYKLEAQRVFSECVEHFAPLMRVVPREIKLTSARTQWGNCSAQGVIRLNWQLVTMPLPLIDYVVIHELAHLREMNHSPAFWRVVAGVCPDYVKIRKELRNWNTAVDEGM